MSQPTSPWRGFGFISVAIFIASLDLFIVNIAFPAIGEDFPEASVSGLSWILSAYAIVFAALLVPFGKLGDLVGRLRVFRAGLAVFTLGSALCALAPSAELLVAARVVQAAGAAAITPTSLGLVLPSFPPERRSAVIGAWAALGGVGAAMGPPLGGLLVSFSWHWIFVINVPLGLLCLAFVGRYFTEIRDPSGRLPDGVGAVLAVACVGLLALGLAQGPDWGWDWRVLVSLAGAVVAGALLVARSRRHLEPVLALDLLRSPTFSLASLATFLFFAGFAGLLLGNVLFLTGVWGYSSLRAGLAFAPGPMLAAVSAALSGRVADHIGSPALLGVPGGILFALGASFYLRLPADPHYLSHFLPGSILTGTGVGLCLPALTGSALLAVPAPALATGVATTTAFRQIGGALGVATFVAVHGTPGPGEMLAAFDRSFGLVTACGLAAATVLAVLTIRLRSAGYVDARAGARAASSGAPAS
jgi:EmrB/QacA subfamily drug resistance transporter